MSDFAAAQGVLRNAIRDGAFPAAVAEVGHHDVVLWQESFGHLTHKAGALPTTLNTVFDLASLTKVVATTTLAMRAIDRGRLELGEALINWLAEWRGADRKQVTIRHLLSHSSGLTAHLPFFSDCRGRAEFEPAICMMPLEYSPGSQSLYSDLGFILLGFVLEDAEGEGLDVQFAALAECYDWGELRFRPPMSWRTRTAATEIDKWRGRLLVGEVHDGNAWALGGVAGHSGLFGTTGAVGSFARTVLKGFRREVTFAQPDTFRIFTTPIDIDGSSRALGWDMMRRTSSCGTKMSRVSVGHTGFTGTSLWIDPSVDLYIVLLTNRVYPTRNNDAILRVRPAFHDAVVEALTG